MGLLHNFNESTLGPLKDAKSDHLWFKTNTKLGKLYFDRNDFSKLQKILKQLHQSCQTDDGEDELKEGIYAFETRIEDFLRNIRTQVLIKLIRPYKNIAIPFIANALNIEPAEVETQFREELTVLQMDKESRCAARYSEKDKWTNQIQSLQLAVCNKMA